MLLLERDRLTSGTTWHAAGLMVTFGSLSATSTELRKYSKDLYANVLPEETGLSCGFSPCGFDDEAAAARFQRRVVERLFRGQYSYCGEERNPHVDAMLANARAKHQPEEPLLMTRRNCTGQPANDFNKPKVDLGPEALRYLPRGACGERTVGGGSDDGAEATLKRGVAFVRLS